MSRASDWAALVASANAATVNTESAKPLAFYSDGVVFSVNRDGSLNISGPPSADLTTDELTLLWRWLSDTFGPLS